MYEIELVFFFIKFKTHREMAMAMAMGMGKGMGYTLFIRLSIIFACLVFFLQYMYVFEDVQILHSTNLWGVFLKEEEMR